MEPTPLDRTAGLSPNREKFWGMVGALTGSGFGIGAALIAYFIDGMPMRESGMYPSIFKRPDLLALDVFLLIGLCVGAAFGIAGLLYARNGKYPRTDAYGAMLMAVILLLLCGVILFIRLSALLGTV